MVLDLLLSGILLFFAITGAVTGALAQALRLGAVIVCSLAGRPVGTRLAPVVGKALDLPPVLASLIGTTLSFFGLYLLLRILANLIAKRATRGQDARAFDRGAGAFLGFARAAFVTWVLLSGLVLLEKPVAKLGWRFDGSGSFFAAVARSQNFFSSFALPFSPRLPKP